jgi:cysteine synthase A
MKDRVALQIIEDAEATGELRPGDVIVESSSGTMAEGLARVGALKGYTVIVVTDPRIDDIMTAKLRALGAEIEIVETYREQGGWQSARLERVREVVDRTPRAFWARQYDSASNPAAYSEVGEALAECFGGRLAALVGAVGTGGSLCGIARSLRRHLPNLRVIAVDAVGSVLFHQPNRTRLQSGHGNSLVPGNIDYSSIDEVHWVSDGEAFGACRELARNSGLVAGGSSGATYLVSSWIAESLPGDQCVVAILPDRGDRYCGTIYSDSFLAERALCCSLPRRPQRIRYGLEVAGSWSFAPLPHDRHVPYHAPEATRTADLARTLGLGQLALR